MVTIMSALVTNNHYATSPSALKSPSLNTSSIQTKPNIETKVEEPKRQSLRSTCNINRSTLARTNRTIRQKRNNGKRKSAKHKTKFSQCKAKTLSKFQSINSDVR